MKRKYWIIIAIVVIIILVIIFRSKIETLIVGKAPAAVTRTSTPPPAAAGKSALPSAPAVSATPLNYDLLLQYGSQGPEVKQLQIWLNNVEGAGLTTDGIFGNDTLSALENYSYQEDTTLNEFIGLYESVTSQSGNSNTGTVGTATASGDTFLGAIGNWFQTALA